MLRFVFKTFGNPKARILRGARTWLCINAAYLVFKGWKWILADKSWLNHLKKKTHSRFFVLLLLRVRQVSPLSRVRRRTNAERNATTERRRARTRNHIKVTLIPRFHLHISFYINYVFTYISCFSLKQTATRNCASFSALGPATPCWSPIISHHLVNFAG